MILLWRKLFESVKSIKNKHLETHLLKKILRIVFKILSAQIGWKNFFLQKKYVFQGLGALLTSEKTLIWLFFLNWFYTSFQLSFNFNTVLNICFNNFFNNFFNISIEHCKLPLGIILWNPLSKSFVFPTVIFQLFFCFWKGLIFKVFLRKATSLSHVVLQLLWKYLAGQYCVKHIGD